MHPFATPPSTTRRCRRTATAVLAAAALVVGLAACEPEPPPPAPTSGMWISRAEIARLPTTGAAWTNLSRAANGSWGTASLSDNNATHDTSTLAGALVAARTGDAAMTTKTRAGIMAVTRVTSYARVLEMSRNITSYVVAADVIGLPAADDARFRTFISDLRTKPLQGHSGGKDLVTTAQRSPSNWGAMARAATVAIDVYLGDRAGLDQMAATHRAWLGAPASHSFVWSDTRWHATSDRAGINRRGTTISGRSVDGVLPEDQRRTGEPSSGAPAEGSYPWEALQGAIVTGVLLDRAGLVDFDAGDRALARAGVWLTTTNTNPATGDDAWQPWVLNAESGTTLPTTAGVSPGKNMGWTDWTHAS